MEYLECYYDQTKPGAPWDVAIEMALAGYSLEQRRKVQLICRPECMRPKQKRDGQMQLEGMR